MDLRAPSKETGILLPAELAGSHSLPSSDLCIKAPLSLGEHTLKVAGSLLRWDAGLGPHPSLCRHLVVMRENALPTGRGAEISGPSFVLLNQNRLCSDSPRLSVSRREGSSCRTRFGLLRKKKTPVLLS